MASLVLRQESKLFGTPIERSVYLTHCSHLLCFDFYNQIISTKCAFHWDAYVRGSLWSWLDPNIVSDHQEIRPFEPGSYNLCSTRHF